MYLRGSDVDSKDLEGEGDAGKWNETMIKVVTRKREDDHSVG